MKEKTPQQVIKTAAVDKGWLNNWRGVPDAACYLKSDSSPFMKIQYDTAGDVHFADLFDKDGELLDTTERRQGNEETQFFIEQMEIVLTWIKTPLKELKTMEPSDRAKRYFPDLVKS